MAKTNLIAIIKAINNTKIPQNKDFKMNIIILIKIIIIKILKFNKNLQANKIHNFLVIATEMLFREVKYIIITIKIKIYITLIKINIMNNNLI